VRARTPGARGHSGHPPSQRCPLLLRLFPQQGGHHKLGDYAAHGKLPQGEIQVHTWMDADLRELAELVKEMTPAARSRRARISFALVFPDKRGRNIMRLVRGGRIGVEVDNGGGKRERTRSSQLRAVLLLSQGVWGWVECWDLKCHECGNSNLASTPRRPPHPTPYTAFTPHSSPLSLDRTIPSPTPFTSDP